LRINEPVARVCSVWAQALEEAPLEEIDFEEEVRSLPSVVEIEDEFEMAESVAPALGTTAAIAEVDIVEASTDWDMVAEPVIEIPTEEIIEEAIEATEEIAEATIAEPVIVASAISSVASIASSIISSVGISITGSATISQSVLASTISTSAIAAVVPKAGATLSAISNSSSISTTDGKDLTSSSKSISSNGASSSAWAQTEQTLATGSFILKQVTQIFAFSGCQIHG
jgi:hypothetical protein